MAPSIHASTSSQYPRTAAHVGYMTQKTPLPGPVAPNVPTEQAVHPSYTRKTHAPQAPQALQACISHQIPEPSSASKPYRPLFGQYASRIIGSVGQAPGYHRVVPSSGPLVQESWIHTPNNAVSTARTTWQQQQQQQQQCQQQQQQQQGHLQQQAYLPQQVHGQRQQFQRVQQLQQQLRFPGAAAVPSNYVATGLLDPRRPHPQIPRRL
ncbi:hypothetical protein BGZ70_000825 [Mortierella alpina]|uniref:Uncharacterized protein n=1 Tax=Mortierella alpina TaxID=64518 RepID=A0A9P6IX84_MORAP|nr:hypothetical protein BGZ70_000825 [Mortierella alpina]